MVLAQVNFKSRQRAPIGRYFLRKAYSASIIIPVGSEQAAPTFKEFAQAF
jgi:hypothetical protein